MNTVPALVGIDGCPFDWDGNTPPAKLSGGRIIIELSETYAYGFFDDSTGRLVHVLVLAKPHVAIEEYLTGNIWVEIGKIWAQILREYRRPEDGFNISINVGYLGGQRIDDTHGHGIPREIGRPSTGMGLKLLTERFDSLAVDVRNFAEHGCTPEVRDGLLSIVTKATQL